MNQRTFRDVVVVIIDKRMKEKSHPRNRSRPSYGPITRERSASDWDRRRNKIENGRLAPAVKISKSRKSSRDVRRLERKSNVKKILERGVPTNELNRRKRIKWTSTDRKHKFVCIDYNNNDNNISNRYDTYFKVLKNFTKVNYHRGRIYVYFRAILWGYW